MGHIGNKCSLATSVRPDLGYPRILDKLHRIGMRLGPTRLGYHLSRQGITLILLLLLLLDGVISLVRQCVARKWIVLPNQIGCLLCSLQQFSILVLHSLGYHAKQVCLLSQPLLICQVRLSFGIAKRIESNTRNDLALLRGDVHDLLLIELIQVVVLEDPHNTANNPSKKIPVNPANLELGQLFWGIVFGLFRQGLHLGIHCLYILQVVTGDQACYLLVLLQCFVPLVGVVTYGSSSSSTSRLTTASATTSSSLNR